MNNFCLALSTFFAAELLRG